MLNDGAFGDMWTHFRGSQCIGNLNALLVAGPLYGQKEALIYSFYGGSAKVSQSFHILNISESRSFESWSSKDKSKWDQLQRPLVLGG